MAIMEEQPFKKHLNLWGDKNALFIVHNKPCFYSNDSACNRSRNSGIYIDFLGNLKKCRRNGSDQQFLAY